MEPFSIGISELTVEEELPVLNILAQAKQMVVLDREWERESANYRRAVIDRRDDKMGAFRLNWTAPNSQKPTYTPTR